MIELCVRGGSIVTSNGEYRADVFIDEGKIAAITAPDDGDAQILQARESIDATGKYVLPGMFDSHTHFRTWSEHSDSFIDVMESAALGGLSTVIGFIAGANSEAGDVTNRVQRVLADAEKTGSPVDYAFHVILTEEERDPISQLEAISELGIRSAKLFMTYADRGLMVSDDFMFRAMSELHRLDGMAMVHAELNGPIASIEEQLRAHGGLTAENFGANRPTWLEAEGARRAAEYALRTGCPLYVVHVSCEEGIDVIVDARRRGAQIYMETCPQYLNLDESTTVELGARAKVAPPLRSARDRKAVTDAVIEGIVDVVASDHSPKNKNLTDTSAKYFAQAPVGAPGTQTLIPMTWRALEANDRSLSDLVRVTATRPAQIFGLDHQKGAIEVGRDADLTIVDTSVKSHISSSDQRSQTGYTLYDGFEIPMRIETVIRRGRVANSGALAEDRAGAFLSPRAK